MLLGPFVDATCVSKFLSMLIDVSEEVDVIGEDRIEDTVELSSVRLSL